MPKQLPPVETRFKKGVSGNPGGRPASPIMKEFREITYKQFVESLQKYGDMTREELQADLKRPDATMFELMFGHIVAQAAKGDHYARNLLIDRLWGKITAINISQTPMGSQVQICDIKGPWDLKEIE